MGDRANRIDAIDPREGVRVARVHKNCRACVRVAADLGFAVKNRRASGIETYYLSNTNDRATIRLARMENHLAYMTGVRPASADVSYIVSDMIQRYKVGESQRFARLIQRALVEQARVQHSSVRNLGVKPGPFAVLVGAGMPAVLVEISFLSNREEGKRLEDEHYREALAEGIWKGITQFGLARHIASTL